MAKKLILINSDTLAVVSHAAHMSEMSANAWIIQAIREKLTRDGYSLPGPDDCKVVPVVKAQPIAGVDYDLNAPMCQDDYEALTRTGQYSQGAK